MMLLSGDVYAANTEAAPLLFIRPSILLGVALFMGAIGLL
jgi:hypothetical protein